ncbi:hypothetical protein [Arthrobacter sp. 131MFCol6.1]|uniref:hypothetical protein n=1 Tax=Arthrobacter sp. 131MFCol6.1 TaxID=1157944 RepID=UPI001E426748|nr:hypothetical protein [Arthrobacter sp. 131MFCol6.1]
MPKELLNHDYGRRKELVWVAAGLPTLAHQRGQHSDSECVPHNVRRHIEMGRWPIRVINAGDTFHGLVEEVVDGAKCWGPASLDDEQGKRFDNPVRPDYDRPSPILIAEALNAHDQATDTNVVSSPCRNDSVDDQQVPVPTSPAERLLALSNDPIPICSPVEVNDVYERLRYPDGSGTASLAKPQEGLHTTWVHGWRGWHFAIEEKRCFLSAESRGDEQQAHGIISLCMTGTELQRCWRISA